MHQPRNGGSGCRFSFRMADSDVSTCGFAEFSSEWRTGFSHLRGGSENRTVVHNSTPGLDCPAIGGSGNRVHRATWCCSLFRVIGTVKRWQLAADSVVICSGGGWASLGGQRSKA
jgi:hypothetical protein